MARIYPSANKMARPATENKVGKGEQSVDIRKMNTAQLTAKAAELGIDISGCKNNPERADLIIAAIETGAATPEADAGDSGDANTDTGDGGGE